MQRRNSLGTVWIVAASLLAVALAGCQNNGKPGEQKPVVQRPTIRVNAGGEEWKDSRGNVWAEDTGFDGGSSIDRPDLEIAGTDMQRLYQSEHYAMDSYSFTVPNGKYLLRLHFSEDFEGIASPEDRVFTYRVKDGTPKDGKVVKEVKDFSPWRAAGAHSKAYVDSVPVEVTNGAISITFDFQVENPQINGIEIIPQ
jgi:hypothetical protein